MLGKILLVAISAFSFCSAGWFEIIGIRCGTRCTVWNTGDFSKIDWNFLEAYIHSMYPQPDWRDLSVTFGSFNRLPRTREDAVGWVLSKSCAGNNNFYGNRYTLNGDEAVMLLFDKNGYIAGLQTKIPKTNEYPDARIGQFFVEEDGSMVITAYFVNDPATICTRGRTEEEFEREGTGTALHIPTGDGSLMRIPMLEKDMKNTRWNGRCFFAMGQHYWYNLRSDMDCKEFYPVFAMYNGGKLNAFGWAFYGSFDSSRYEHPSNKNLYLFMDPVPTCLTSGAFTGFSTIHIYLDRRPYFNLC